MTNTFKDYGHFERHKYLVGEVVGDADTSGYVIALTFVNVLLEKNILRSCTLHIYRCIKITNNQIKVFLPNLHIVENYVMLELDSVASAVVLIGFHQIELVPEITFLVFFDTFGNGRSNLILS